MYYKLQFKIFSFTIYFLFMSFLIFFFLFVFVTSLIILVPKNFLILNIISPTQNMEIVSFNLFSKQNNTYFSLYQKT